MKKLSVLAAVMKPAIEIDGFDPLISYRCEKCSNKKSKDVRHPKAIFRVLDRKAWSEPLSGAPFMYLLTAVARDTGIEAPRYVGIAKASCLMRRWTRIPDGESLNFSTGSLIHHMPATIPRLSRDFSDPAFQKIQGLFRLYMTTSTDLMDRLPRPSLDHYSFIESVEAIVIEEMYEAGLSPWNRTRGLVADLSSTVLSRNVQWR